MRFVIGILYLLGDWMRLTYVNNRWLIQKTEDGGKPGSHSIAFYSLILCALFYILYAILLYYLGFSNILIWGFHIFVVNEL